MKLIRDDGEITVEDVKNEYPGKYIVDTCDGWIVFDTITEFDTWCNQD